MRTWGLDKDHLCSFRPKWVFVESLRRCVVCSYVNAALRANEDLQDWLPSLLV